MNTVDTSTIANVLAIARPSRIPVRSMIVSVARRSGRFISRSRSVADAITARHPVPPHQQAGPAGSTTVWAIEPTVALGTAQPPTGDDARRLDRGVDDERERTVDLPGRAEPALTLREGGSCRTEHDRQAGEILEMAAERERRPRGNQVRRDRPGGLIERRGGAHPHRPGGGDVVGRGGQHTTDELLDDPPHVRDSEC